MKTIVFIGTNKSGSSYEAIKASEALNYYTVLLTDRKSFFDKRLDFAHVHSMRMCNLDNINDIRSAIDRIDQDRFSICAIVSFIDPHCHTAALLSREFGLKSFTETAIEIMLDKTKSRNVLSGTPYSPPYHIASSKDATSDIAIPMPVVLKAPVSSASKDVHMVSNDRQYQHAFADLRQRYPDSAMLVEKYIPGPQYLVETLTVNGKVHIIAIVEQEIIFSGRFIVTGYQMITDDDSQFFRQLKAAAQSIIFTHGMHDGPCHLELRHFDNSWKLIEANPRISGGAMNLLIETAFGINLAEETLKSALGLAPDLKRTHKKEAFLQYIVVPKGGVLTKVTGKNMVRNSPGITHVYVKPKKGSVLIPPASMGHRYAYVIGTGASPDEARKHAKSGAAKIKFNLRPNNIDTRNPTENASGMNHPHIGMDYFANNIIYES
ncbi:MAG: ATP-grasp domain-containing protein [Oscillospiraceae bacterium]|nr:ATP-grasp domain-containing protein [Oscillospiraceae bacterium]